MNPDLSRLHPYPFERLRDLLHGVEAREELSPVSLAIGEPRHPTPALVTRALAGALDGLSRYPVTRGDSTLRAVIAAWLARRFHLPDAGVDPERHVLPVNGTREALFAFAQCVVDRGRDAVVLMPNPFYQIYEGAALLAGATPYYVNCTADSGYLPDLDRVPDAVWRRCQLLYLCSPGNPTGAVLDTERLERVLELSEQFDFVIAADECYSEIYTDEASPPPGLLEVAHATGRTDFTRCMVFHSLSKRSNAPGLRSGFVAGDERLIKAFHLYRTYHGCAMSPPVQAASTAAWRDEEHVRLNRALYREKFGLAMEILAPVLDVTCPPAGFYLWPATPVDDTSFARDLFAHANLTVLPGSFLSRDTASGNPGSGRVRIALVPDPDSCREALLRVRDFVAAHY